MLDFISKLFILTIGLVVGFFIACMGAARIVAEKADLKKELAKITKERDELAKLRGEADQLKTYNKELFDENQKLNATLAAHKIPNPTFKF